MEDNDDEFKRFENITNKDDGHDFVVVKVDVVCHFWILAYAFQSSIKEVFDLLHKHSSIQKPNSWNQPIALDQVEESTVWKIQEKVEWNEWKEVIDELSMDISHADQRDVLYFLVGNFICVFKEELEDAIEKKHQFHEDLQFVEFSDFRLFEHSCINLVWSWCPP